jgi:hypothetical protein
MDHNELQRIVDSHGAWRCGDSDGRRANLSGADLSGADLRGADLRWAYLRGAYLSGADLRGAYLSGADLSGAYLRGADLSGAYLRGADLSGADLSGAYLRGAYLSGADLSGADLRGAYLRGADLGKAVGVLRLGPLGSRGDDLYAVQWEDGPRVKAGCFWGTLPEFLAAVEETHGDNEYGRAYRAAAELIRVWADSAVLGQIDRGGESDEQE